MAKGKVTFDQERCKGCFDKGYRLVLASLCTLAAPYAPVAYYKLSVYTFQFLLKGTVNITPFKHLYICKYFFF